MLNSKDYQDFWNKDVCTISETINLPWAPLVLKICLIRWDIYGQKNVKSNRQKHKDVFCKVFQESLFTQLLIWFFKAFQKS